MTLECRWTLYAGMSGTHLLRNAFYNLVTGSSVKYNVTL